MDAGQCETLFFYRRLNTEDELRNSDHLRAIFATTVISATFFWGGWIFIFISSHHKTVGTELNSTGDHNEPSTN
jgi:hypothetical protein